MDTVPERLCFLNAVVYHSYGKIGLRNFDVGLDFLKSSWNFVREVSLRKDFHNHEILSLQINALEDHFPGIIWITAKPFYSFIPFVDDCCEGWGAVVFLFGLTLILGVYLSTQRYPNVFLGLYGYVLINIKIFIDHLLIEKRRLFINFTKLYFVVFLWHLNIWIFINWSYKSQSGCA